jgi:membrane fusion protein, adhesin transport system
VDGVPFEPAPELQKNPDILRNEMALYHSRQSELEAGINVLRQSRRQKEEELSGLIAESRTLKESLALARQELEMKQPLVEKGVLPRIETLGIERDVNALAGRLEANEHSIPRAQGALAEIDQRIEERRANFKTQALAELNDNKVNLARLDELVRTQEDRVRRTEVMAPVTGTIKEVKVNTLGGVIQPGMDLIEIVPTEESLIVEAEVSPRDIAFLHPGQDAVVKVTAYDFAIYGGLKATLESISADTILNDAGNRVYRIRLRTTQNHLAGADRPLPIIPGMAAEVDIVTGNKTVMTYLLKPLRRARDRALTER